MKAVTVAGLAAAGVAAMGALAAGQIGSTASSNRPEANAAVDATEICMYPMAIALPISSEDCRNAIPRHYGNYAYRLLENFVPRCDLVE